MGQIRAQIQAIVCLLPAVLDAIDAFFAVEIDHAQFDSDPMQVHGHHDAIFLKFGYSNKQHVLTPKAGLKDVCGH